MNILLAKAQWIKANGDIEEVQPSDGKTFSLEELQKFVGGYIEVIGLLNINYPRQLLVCNENGKLEHLPVNEKATEVWDKHYGASDVIVGDVLITDPEFME